MNTDHSASHPHKLHLLLLTAVVLTAMPATADVRLARIFTSNMMLQRDMPVRIWGWADAGEAVSATLSGNTATTRADNIGQWALELPAIKAGEGLTLTVTGKNTLALNNIIVGDIWVCSGQSNMDMKLNDCLGAHEDINAADLPKIRHIKIAAKTSGQPELFLSIAWPWEVCTANTARNCTAVGFYFAREIVKKTGVPIGIIDTVPFAERDNIHPSNKYDVGLRLARWALSRDYGQKHLEVSGPLFQSLKIEGGKARLTFDHTGTGLMAGKKEGRTPAVEDRGAKLKSFAIAGGDRKWVWADAAIDGTTVTVSSPEVKEPVAVRYAYQANPDGANLYNREGLPASPFRSDDW